VRETLPVIVSFLAWGKVDPPSFPEGREPETCEGTEVLRNNFKGTTIGPRYVRRPVVPGELLDELIAVVQVSRQQKWIRDQHVSGQLREKLGQAKQRLENTDSRGAAERIESLIHDVRASSCQDVSCDDKAMSGEAYALLFYNARFLARHLRGQPE
jgi:hypothetical protein